MKKAKIAKAVVTVAATATIVATVGQIIPVNLLSGSNDFSFTQVQADCCGPHVSCECPDFKYVPAD